MSSRAERLLALMQALRRHRNAVSGARLAQELDVSLRTVYRDIASLQAQGADIEGAPGVGYVLRPGFLLPPLMLSAEEVESLVLGARWVAERSGDGELAAASRNLVAKLAAVLPRELRKELEGNTLFVGAGAADLPSTALRDLRAAIRAECRVRLRYRDAQARESERVIWPFALGYFDGVRMVAAWCEQREDFRHFRVDRIGELAKLSERYPTRRGVLLRQWRAREGIGAPSI